MHTANALDSTAATANNQMHDSINSVWQEETGWKGLLFEE